MINATKDSSIISIASRGHSRKGSIGIIALTVALALSLFLLLKSDLGAVTWASKLSAQGDAAPQRDAKSLTGYVLGQRHFLATHERGETYRWITTTQDLVAFGPFSTREYSSDNAPEGRRLLMPRLYTGWLATISQAVHVFTGEPIARSVELSALWEPVISHILIFIFLILLVHARYGAGAAAAVALLYVFFPPLSAQFIPGALSPRTWALALTAYALVLHFPRTNNVSGNDGFSVLAAIATSIALWLEPALGFTVIVITFAVGVGHAAAGLAVRALRWSAVDAGLALAACFFDRAPVDPSEGELRYVHLYYTLAWLGLGAALCVCEYWRAQRRRAFVLVVGIITAVLLTAPLVYTQITKHFAGWLYPSAALRRISSLDETAVFDNLFDWFAATSSAGKFVIGSMALLVIAALIFGACAARGRPREVRVQLMTSCYVMLGLLILTTFRVRWGVVVSLVAIPFCWSFGNSIFRRATVVVCAVICAVSFAVRDRLPNAFVRPEGSANVSAADLDAMINRHFSHWLASHTFGKPVVALASPDVSDSLIFHGNSKVLMSTAWESYRGRIAASRILSAPEASEAEAVLEGHGVTHVVLNSWDKVLPLLVRQPIGEGTDTLYARLQRWRLPPYLRALPYRLPDVPGYENEKFVVFKVVPTQDDALALSRLAEYFAEVKRPEPATLAAKALAEGYPDDPNAAIAQAVVYAETAQSTAFRKPFSRLIDDVMHDRGLLLWDRRVQRAIVLALGGRNDLARAEIEACVATATTDALAELTPLQAFRLSQLATHFATRFPRPELTHELSALGSEYAITPGVP